MPRSDSASRSDPAELRAALELFLSRVDAIWDAYRAGGPGSLDARVCDGLEDAAGEVTRLFSADETTLEQSSLLPTVRTLTKLCQQCVTPQGLCFITGEAGLIPRRDQHEAFEEALGVAKEALQRVKSADTR